MIKVFAMQDGQMAAQLAGQTKMTDYIDPFVTHMNQSIKLARQLHYSLWFYSSIKCAGHNQSHQLCLQFKSVTGAGIAQLVVLGLAVHSVVGSILLWGHFR